MRRSLFLKGSTAMPYDQWMLPNGLRVVGERLTHLRSCTIGVWVRVGSMMETPGENGLSHFIEHMVFKGTKRRSARDIAEEMDAVGGQLNAFTGKDCTCFYAKVIDEDLPLAVDMLSDLTLNAVMASEELEKERGVILEEISMTEDTPDDLVHEVLSLAAFGDQALAMPILGERANIEGVNRNDLLTFQHRHYMPENAVIAIAGNYDVEALKALIDQYFGTWGALTAPAMPAPMQALTGQCLFREKDTEQTHICIGYRGLPLDDPGSYAQSVLSLVVGGGMSSRLFQRIREDLGMAYSVYSYSGSYPGSGTFNIYAGTAPKNAKQVLEEVFDQLRLLRREGIPQKEFAQAKAQLRGTYILGLESASGRMQSIARGELLLGRPKQPDDIIACIDAVALEDVLTLAERIFAEAPCGAVVGRKAAALLPGYHSI